MNDPFRYVPSPAIEAASKELIARIDADPMLRELFSEGKMLGVLQACDTDGREHFLFAFSGNVSGRNMLDGFVPPVFDLLDPQGWFKTEEAAISAIDIKAKALVASPEYQRAKDCVQKAEQSASEELEAVKTRMAESKAAREEARRNGTADEAALVAQSQWEKAELKRLKKRLEASKQEAGRELALLQEKLSALKNETARRSDALQDWIFGNFRVHNALGEEQSVKQIFARRNLMAPGGTGECAGPKLLEYAYRNKLKPLAMGEFWYGTSPAGKVRESGRFYPSCTAKCGPLLSFMLEGMDVDRGSSEEKWRILWEDEELIVASKPSGMLSAPGKTADKSLLELLQEQSGRTVLPVNRLDMDTSGIILFAKNTQAQARLRAQFEGRSIYKMYQARLDAGITVSNAGERTVCTNSKLQPGVKGEIDLPLSADISDRPRQMVDKENGRSAQTRFFVETCNEDGSTDVLFFPKTGRTHQLRVHSSHPEGLGVPIQGDRLYGSSSSGRLCLHAAATAFHHPSSGEFMSFTDFIKPLAKAGLRQHVAACIKAMTPEDRRIADESLKTALLSSEQWRKASVIHLYESMKDEPQMAEIIAEAIAQGKKAVLPVIDGNSLYFKDSQTNEIVNVEAIDLAIIPGRAFTRNCMRMGRGKGYYDRTLSAMKCPKTALAYNCQIMDSIPTDPWDLPLDGIITP